MKNSYLKFTGMAAIRILATSLMLVSCVSQLKYNRVSEEVVSLRNERESLQKRAESLKLQLEATAKDYAREKDLNSSLKLDSSQFYGLYMRYKDLFDDCSDKYDRLDKSYNTLLANSSSDQKETDKELLEKEREMLKLSRDLEDMKVQIGKAKTELDQKKQEMDKLSQVVGQKDEKIREMQTQIASRDKLVSDFKARMDAAVRELNNSELIVSQKAGKVYVNIPNGSLFGTGETALQENGKTALKKLAQVLAQNEEFDVSVEGHTDISPYRPPTAAAAPAAKAKTTKSKGKAALARKPAPAKPSSIKDNWDLSAIRAASVARELYLLGIAGDRISATGKGEFHPMDNSASEEARRRNRRVEIVIGPKMQGVLDLMSPGSSK
jgi:chemotaxis protein MotB